MGWEGYSQNFCENGHFFRAAMGPGEDEDVTACACGAAISRSNIVDDTNCDAVGVIPDEVLAALLIREQKTELCNLGHIHVVERAVYRIPSEEEFEAVQHRWDYVNEKFEPLDTKLWEVICAVLDRLKSNLDKAAKEAQEFADELARRDSD